MACKNAAQAPSSEAERKQFCLGGSRKKEVDIRAARRYYHIPLDERKKLGILDSPEWRATSASNRHRGAGTRRQGNWVFGPAWLPGGPRERRLRSSGRGRTWPEICADGEVHARVTAHDHRGRHNPKLLCLCSSCRGIQRLQWDSPSGRRPRGVRRKGK